MSESSKAVFLSYASQDAAAVSRIAEALRAAGAEVWFDQNELVGGDAWDQKIRRQIKECALFVPVISANTNARAEGYFRLEWKLAVDRSHLLADDHPFLFPVVIDDTTDAAARVPDKFREVQWTRLNVKDTPDTLARRVTKLLGGAATTETSPTAIGRASGPASRSGDKFWRWFGYAWGLVGLLIGLSFVFRDLWPSRSREPKPTAEKSAAARAAAPAVAAAPQSDARQLAEKARTLFDSLDGTRDDFKLAEELIDRAKTKDATDAEVNAAEAQLHERYILRGWDPSDARREAARAVVQRAVRLDPQSFEVRWAQAGLLGYAGREGEERTRELRELRRERPTDQRILRALASGLERSGHLDEAVAIMDESAALPGGDPLALYNKSQTYWFVGRTAEAEAAIKASIAQKPFTGALLMNVWYKTILHGDLEGARTWLNRIDPAHLIEDRAAYFGFIIEWLARRPDAAIARLATMPRDWINDSWYRGPKGLLVGDALQLAGRPEAAAVERRAALKLVEQRLVTNPNDPKLLYNRCELVAKLGQREEAERVFAVLLQMAGIDLATQAAGSSSAAAACALLGRKADALRIISAGLKRGTHAVEFTAADLRLNPDWDPLRGEPEFAGVIAEAERIEQAAARPAAKP